MNLLISEHPKVHFMQLKQKLKRVTSFLLASVLVTSTHLYAADTPCDGPLVETRYGFKVAYSACTVNTLYTDSYVRIQQQSTTMADCGASTGGFPSSPATNNRGGFVSQTCGNWSNTTQRCGAFSGTINLDNVGDYCVAVRTDQGEEVIVHAAWDGTTFNSVGALYRDILEVTGNNVSITDGDSSPQTTDNTDFGNVAINSTKTHTFVVTNNSSQSITLNSITISAYSSQAKSTTFLDKLLASFDPISIAWAAVLAPEFTKVSPNGAVTIAAGASQNFEIKFAPTTLGLQQAQVDLEAGNGTTHSFVIQGTGVAAPPVANNDTNTFTVNEDAAAFTINSAALLTNDTGDTLSIQSVTAVTGGTVVLSADKTTITFTPTANFNGTAKFTYTIIDNLGRTASAEVAGTITPVDDAPTVSNPPTAVTVNEDAANSSIDLSNVFTDIEGDTLTLSIGGNTNPSLVTPSLLNGTNLILAYAPNQNGSATLTIRATANGKVVDTNLVVTVNPVDDAPVVSTAIPSVTVAEGAANSILDLTNTFTDIDSSTITLSVLSNTNATLVTPSLSSKTLTLAYAANQSGNSTLTIRATADGKTVDTTLVVTITPVDDAPVVDTPIPPVTVNEDAANTIVDLTNTFRDPDGSTISLSVFSNDNSTLVTPTLSGKSLTLAYAANQNGTANIVIRATADGKTVDTPLIVTVNPIDDAPIVKTPIPAVTVVEGATNSVLDLTNTFTDIDSSTITLSVLSNSNPALVTPSLSGKTLTLAYAVNQSGSATIIIRATANGKTVDTPVQVTVTAKKGIQISANGQLISNGDTTPSSSDCTDYGTIKITGESKTCTYTLSNLDATPITLTITQAEVASSASLLSWPKVKLVLKSFNPITSAWAIGFADFTASTSSITVPANGTASFSIIFDPSAAGLRESLVSLSTSGAVINSFRIAGTGVASASPPLVTNPIAPLTLNENSPNTTINLAGVFKDPDNQALTLSIVGNTNSNLVTPTLNGNTLTLTYAPNQTGSAIITIRATAADGETVETSFTVTVNAVVAIPIFSPLGLLLVTLGLAWFGSSRRRSS